MEAETKKVKKIGMSVYEKQTPVDIALSFVYASTLTYLLATKNEFNSDNDIVESIFERFEDFNHTFVGLAEDAAKDAPDVMKEDAYRAVMVKLHMLTAKDMKGMISGMNELVGSFANNSKAN